MKICPWIFIAALFIITRQQKQAKCSLPDERINEMCQPCNIILFCNRMKFDTGHKEGEPWKHFAKETLAMKPVIKAHILYDSIYIKYLE